MGRNPAHWPVPAACLQKVPCPGWRALPAAGHLSTGRMAVPGKGHERMGQMGRRTGTAGTGRRMARRAGLGAESAKKCPNMPNSGFIEGRAKERTIRQCALVLQGKQCSNSEKSGSNRSCSGPRPPARACSGFYSFLSAGAEDSEQYGQPLVLLLQF